MKTTTKLLLFAFTLGCAFKAEAQSYPADPSLPKIVSDIKKDPKAKEMMKSYGYNPADIDRGTYRNAKKSELKDYYYTNWYGRSKHAYKVSMNKNYNDERFFAIFLTTPKDANGVSHKIFFKVQYNRRTPQDFEDTKWNYEWLVLDPRENESYGLPKISDEERKQIMMKYVIENLDIDQELKSPYHPVRNIVQIDSIHAYSDNVYHFKPLGAGKYLWTLTIRGTYIHDSDNDGGIEETRRGYLSFPMTAVYSNGKYEIKALNYSKSSWDTYAKGWQAMYDDGSSKGQDFDDHVWMETVATVGFEKLINKPILKNQPKGSKSYLTKRLGLMTEAITTLTTGDSELIRKSIMPFMDPSNAKALTDSYVNLIADFKRKLCTLKMYGNKGEIPSRFEMGDLEGPKIVFTIGISRESARSKELKKKYKSAGMSSSVLKSTSRGYEYGLVQNTSYKGQLEVKFIGGEWYITTPADIEKTKVRF